MKTAYLKTIVILVLAAPAWPLEAEDAQLAAVRKRGESYVNAFNNRDADSVAAHWTERSEYVHPLTGKKIQGRDAIAKAFGTLFESEEKMRLSISIDSLRLVADNLAVEDGVATIVSPETPSEQAGYTVVHIKQDGDRPVAARLTECRRSSTDAPGQFARNSAPFAACHCGPARRFSEAAIGGDSRREASGYRRSARRTGCQSACREPVARC